MTLVKSLHKFIVHQITVLLYEAYITKKSCQKVQLHLGSFEKKSFSCGRSFLLQLTVFTVSAPSECVSEISAVGDTHCR
jgi:hypothetical protein